MVIVTMFKMSERAVQKMEAIFERIDNERSRSDNSSRYKSINAFYINVLNY